MPHKEMLRAEIARASVATATIQPRNLMKLLTTKEVATLTGFSTSYFEKGRIYGYGPKFLRIRGKILYRLEDVENWIMAHECEPQGGADV